MYTCRGSACAGSPPPVATVAGAACAAELFDPRRLSRKAADLVADLAWTGSLLPAVLRAADRQPAPQAGAGGGGLHVRRSAGVRRLRKRQRRRAGALSAAGAVGSGGSFDHSPAAQAYPLPMEHRAVLGEGRAVRIRSRADRHRQPAAGAQIRPARRDRGGARHAPARAAHPPAGCERAALPPLRRAGRCGRAQLLPTRPPAVSLRAGDAARSPALLGGRLSGTHSRTHPRAGASGVCRGRRARVRYTFLSFYKGVHLCLSQT